MLLGVCLNRLDDTGMLPGMPLDHEHRHSIGWRAPYARYAPRWRAVAVGRWVVMGVERAAWGELGSWVWLTGATAEGRRAVMLSTGRQRGTHHAADEDCGPMCYPPVGMLRGPASSVAARFRSPRQGDNLGDDADTTGAVCGQLAGAYWSESRIPAEWLEGLAREDMIRTALEGLLGSPGRRATFSQDTFQRASFPLPAY